MLKFDGIAIGSRIKAFDFEPIEGRPDCYIEGEVIQVTQVGGPFGYKAYEVFCEYDSWFKDGDPSEDGNRVYKNVFVPLETSHDYDNRVQVVS